MTQVASNEPLWRAFDADWYRFAYPVVDTLLREGPDRTPEAVYARHGPALLHAPNPYFSETWYRTAYPDVAADVRGGAVRSGFEHFCRTGHAALSPHWLFDPDHYRRQVAVAHRRPFDPATDGDAYDHFLRRGQHEGLSGHPLFDPSVYAALAQYDVVARIRRDGPFTTFLHQVQAGGAEPVVSLLFDPAWYRDRHPRVAAAIADGTVCCALQHYLQDPDAALLDPNPRFSEHGYRAYYRDIQAAIAAGAFRNGFDHYLRHGRDEGRIAFPSGSATRRGPAIPARPAPVTAAFPLRSRQYHDVTFLPDVAGGPVPAGWRLGAFGPDGHPLDGFPCDEGGPLAPMPAIEPCPGVHVYGGLLTDHFGHFLLDGMANLWFLREHPGLPVVWQWDRSAPDGPWPDWIVQVWTLLGLDRHRHIHVRAPLRVEAAILPDSGRQSLFTMHPRQAAALAVRRPNGTGPGPGRRVWLSRRGLPADKGRLEPEERIEAALLARGWSVVRPEALPVAAQADIFATAEAVSGCIGSAFHAVLLCAAPSAHLIPVTRPGAALEFYDLVAEARGLRQSFIVPDLLASGPEQPDAVSTVRDVAALVDAICAAADS